MALGDVIVLSPLVAMVPVVLVARRSLVNGLESAQRAVVVVGLLYAPPAYLLAAGDGDEATIATRIHSLSRVHLVQSSVDSP